MNQTKDSEDCFVAIDAGTTNTRVWLVAHGEIVAHRSTLVGVRDTARDGHKQKLTEALRDLIAQVIDASPEHSPTAVVAAGMITSALGLFEVPHVSAPANNRDIAAKAQIIREQGITSLPIILFPGVRTGLLDSDDWAKVDVMRGEETLVMGILREKVVKPPFSVLNLGSHWKVIQVSEDGSIARSSTSLAGELIFASQSNTILASAVPADQLQELDQKWCERGMTEWKNSGLSRALFCVRLLELQKQTSPAQRMSFLIGVFVAAELAALFANELIQSDTKLILVGKGAVLSAWQFALDQAQLGHLELPGKTEDYFLKGIKTLLDSFRAGF